MNQSSKLAGLLVLLVSLSALAAADTYTYTYTGNALSTFTGNPPAGVTNISASFTTLDPLANNLQIDWSNLSNINAIAFNINEGDGLATLTAGQGATAYINLATDSSGQITEWMFTGLNSVGSDPYATSSLLLATLHVNQPWAFPVYDESCRGPVYAADSYCDQLTFGDTTTYQGGDVAANFKDSGTWTVTDNPTPEPSSLFLLGSGFVTLAGVARKRLSR